MLITNFASGELSPNLNGRVDIQQYYQGASKIENFEIIPTGGIKRRPGTQRLAQLNDNNRIIPFIVDKNAVFILEIGLNPDYDSEVETSKPGLIRIWERQPLGGYAPRQNGIETDYDSLAVISELQYAQNYDTLVFTHRQFKPFIIKYSANAFTGSVMQFDFWPDVELDDDFDYVMIVSGLNFPTKTTDLNGNTVWEYTTLINGVSTATSKTYPSSITDFYCIKDGKLYKWNISEWTVYGEDPETETGLFSQAHKYPGCSFF